MPKFAQEHHAEPTYSFYEKCHHILHVTEITDIEMTSSITNDLN